MKALAFLILLQIIGLAAQPPSSCRFYLGPEGSVGDGSKPTSPLALGKFTKADNQVCFTPGDYSSSFSVTATLTGYFAFYADPERVLFSNIAIIFVDSQIECYGCDVVFFKLGLQSSTFRQTGSSPDDLYLGSNVTVRSTFGEMAETWAWQFLNQNNQLTLNTDFWVTPGLNLVLSYAVSQSPMTIPTTSETSLYTLALRTNTQFGNNSVFLDNIIFLPVGGSKGCSRGQHNNGGSPPPFANIFWYIKCASANTSLDFGQRSTFSLDDTKPLITFIDKKIELQDSLVNTDNLDIFSNSDIKLVNSTVTVPSSSSLSYSTLNLTNSQLTISGSLNLSHVTYASTTPPSSTTQTVVGGQLAVQSTVVHITSAGGTAQLPVFRASQAIFDSVLLVVEGNVTGPVPLVDANNGIFTNLTMVAPSCSNPTPVAVNPILLGGLFSVPSPCSSDPVPIPPGTFAPPAPPPNPASVPTTQAPNPAAAPSAEASQPQSKGWIIGLAVGLPICCIVFVIVIVWVYTKMSKKPHLDIV
jgi:hypothetical protein